VKERSGHRARRRWGGVLGVEGRDLEMVWPGPGPVPGARLVATVEEGRGVNGRAGAGGAAGSRGAEGT